MSTFSNQRLHFVNHFVIFFLFSISQFCDRTRPKFANVVLPINRVIVHRERESATKDFVKSAWLMITSINPMKNLPRLWASSMMSISLAKGIIGWLDNSIVHGLDRTKRESRFKLLSIIRAWVFLLSMTLLPSDQHGKAFGCSSLNPTRKIGTTPHFLENMTIIPPILLGQSKSRSQEICDWKQSLNRHGDCRLPDSR